MDSAKNSYNLQNENENSKSSTWSENGFIFYGLPTSSMLFKAWKYFSIVRILFGDNNFSGIAREQIFQHILIQELPKENYRNEKRTDGRWWKQEKKNQCQDTAQNMGDCTKKLWKDSGGRNRICKWKYVQKCVTHINMHKS